MRKLVWFTVGFAAVCLAVCFTSPSFILPSALAAALLLILSLVSTLSFRKRSPRSTLHHVSRRVLAAALGGLAAAGWFFGWSALFRAPADAMAGSTLTLTATVTSYPSPTSIGGWSMSLSLDGGLTAPDLLIYAPAEWGDLTPGDRVSFTARLEPSHFLYGDETTYYSGKGIFLLGYCNDPPELLGHSDSPRHWPVRCAKVLRDSLSAAFDPEIAPLATAITIGDKTDLDDSLVSALNRSGAAHTVVVSGMHISFLVAAALTLTRRKRQLALAFVPFLLFYALMAGSTPSAFRAVIMQTALLAAPIFRRESDTPTSLSFALLILLLLNPYSVGSLSLQLSFASVSGILVAADPVSRWLLRPAKGFFRTRTRWYWTPLRLLWHWAAISLSVSLGAMLFAEPILCLYFRQLSLTFPLTNLLILWAVPLFFLSSLLVGTLGIFLPGAAAFLAPAAALAGRYIIHVVSAVGRWQFSALDTGNFYYFLFLTAIYLFLAVGILSRRSSLRPAVPACCLTVLLLSALAFSRQPVYGTLSVTALDVGQGASTALMSDGYTCLVDCGGNGSDNAGDTAADHFASMGIRKLDLLVLTHFDGDHFNGVAQLFSRMDIDQVAIPDVETEYGRMESLLALAEKEGAIVTYITGQMSVPLGQAELTLFPPLGSGTSNEEGLFALCSAEDFDVLITGDADSFVEKMLIKYYTIPDIELLLVGHHGSAGSTCVQLLDALRPELAVISVGYNTYGHPTQQVLDRLEERNIQIYRTDTMGSVTIQVRSDGYAAQTKN